MEQIPAIAAALVTVVAGEKKLFTGSPQDIQGESHRVVGHYLSRCAVLRTRSSPSLVGTVQHHPTDNCAPQAQADTVKLQIAP